TPTGARLLRGWLSQPLIHLDGLRGRLDAVAELVEDTAARSAVREELARVRDLERLITRVGQGMAVPREMIALRASLEAIPALRKALTATARPASRRQALAAALDDGRAIVDLIRQAIVPEPPATLVDGGVIATGFSADLDDLRASTEHARRWIESL